MSNSSSFGIKFYLIDYCFKKWPEMNLKTFALMMFADLRLVYTIFINNIFQTVKDHLFS